ncbi:MAG: ABC transporter permease [Microbacteriaceae bacterium]|nr:ABC transporter permease [Microbacteriaceae bacterium]
MTSDSARGRSAMQLLGKSTPSTILLGLIAPLALVALWEYFAATQVISPIFFPPPSRLLEVGLQLAADGTLWLHIGTTLGRLAPAFVLGTFSGLVVGLVLGSSRFMRALWEPSLLALYSVPKIALLPIFLAIFGVGEGALVGLVTTSVFFYVWIYTMTAAMRTPENLLVTARAFGASQFDVVTRVIFRSALPETMSGVRVGVTVALLVCLTAEYVLGADGIGYLILGSRSLGQHAQSYLGIVIASITGLLLQLGVKKLDDLLNPGFKSAFKAL